MEPRESQTLSKSNYIMLQPCRQLYQTNLESYQLRKSSLEAPVLYTSASTKINIMPILQCLMTWSLYQIFHYFAWNSYQST